MKQQLPRTATKFITMAHVGLTLLCMSCGGQRGGLPPNTPSAGNRPTIGASAATHATVTRSQEPAPAVKNPPIEPVTAQVVFTKSNEDDCTTICGKVQTCHVGPFATNKTQCEAACEGSNEDPITSKTYDCIAAATSCTAVQSCVR